MTEDWRRIEGWPYEASSLGRVRRSVSSNGTKAGRVLKPSLMPKGYLKITLTDRYRRRCVKVHSVVCLVFLGPRPSGKQVNHKDFNKANNAIGNLEYVSPSQNIRHAIASGIGRGEAHHSSTLTEAAVREIRTSPESVRFLADKYHAHRNHIGNIKRRTAWAWFKEA